MSEESFAIYMTSRIKAKRSFILEHRQYDELMAQQDADSVAKCLLNTFYEKHIAEALTHKEGADAVEEAANRHLEHVFQQIKDIVRGDREVKKLTSLFMGRWDLIAIKALLRHKHHNLPATGEADSLLPGPTLTMPLIHQFANLESMESLVNALAAWNPSLCRCLVKAYPAYESSRQGVDNSLIILEEALDRAYFSKKRDFPVDDENAQTVRKYLAMEIDRINTRMLLTALSKEGKTPPSDDRILEGGMLEKSLIQQILASASIEQAMTMFENTPYRQLHRGLYQFYQSGRFVSLDRRYELMFLEMLQRVSRIHVFNIAVLMHFIWIKYIEVVNLRVIARGVSARLPHGRIQEEILYV